MRTLGEEREDFARGILRTLRFFDGDSLLEHVDSVCVLSSSLPCELGEALLYDVRRDCSPGLTGEAV